MNIGSSELHNTANVEVKDRLPSGVVVTQPEKGIAISGSLNTTNPGWECDIDEVTGGVQPVRELICKVKVRAAPTKLKPLGLAQTCAEEETEPACLPPIELRNVWVEPQAPSVVVNEAKVSGGEAGEEPASTGGEEGRTAIQTVPFGFYRLSQEILNEEGAAEASAGGHPFALSTELVFNFVLFRAYSTLQVATASNSTRTIPAKDR